MVQGLTNSIVQVISHPRRDPTKFPFELRPQLLDRVVVRTVRRQGQDAGPRRSIDSATCGARWGLRLSKITTSPGWSSGASTSST